MERPCGVVAGAVQCGLILRVFEQLFQRISDEEQEKGLDKLRYSVKCRCALLSLLAGVDLCEVICYAHLGMLQDLNLGRSVNDTDVGRESFLSACLMLGTALRCLAMAAASAAQWQLRCWAAKPHTVRSRL
jgi:hypothetical protein